MQGAGKLQGLAAGVRNQYYHQLKTQDRLGSRSQPKVSIDPKKQEYAYAWRSPETQTENFVKARFERLQLMQYRTVMR